MKRFQPPQRPPRGGAHDARVISSVDSMTRCAGPLRLPPRRLSSSCTAMRPSSVPLQRTAVTGGVASAARSVSAPATTEMSSGIAGRGTDRLQHPASMPMPPAISRSAATPRTTAPTPRENRIRREAAGAHDPALVLLPHSSKRLLEAGNALARRARRRPSRQQGDARMAEPEQIFRCRPGPAPMVERDGIELGRIVAVEQHDRNAELLDLPGSCRSSSLLVVMMMASTRRCWKIRSRSSSRSLRSSVMASEERIAVAAQHLLRRIDDAGEARGSRCRACASDRARDAEPHALGDTVRL